MGRVMVRICELGLEREGRYAVGKVKGSQLSPSIPRNAPRTRFSWCCDRVCGEALIQYSIWTTTTMAELFSLLFITLEDRRGGRVWKINIYGLGIARNDITPCEKYRCAG